MLQQAPGTVVEEVNSAGQLTVLVGPDGAIAPAAAAGTLTQQQINVAYGVQQAQQADAAKALAEQTAATEEAADLVILRVFIPFRHVFMRTSRAFPIQSHFRSSAP